MSIENLQRAYQAQPPTRHCPFGDPQAIADFNEAERKRMAQTPYGRHLARMRAFNADTATDSLTDAEFDALLNQTHRESYAQYLKEQANAENA